MTALHDMFDFSPNLNLPLLTDAGARDLGAATTENLLRAVERADALVARADALLARAFDKRMVFVPLGIIAAFVAYRIAVGLHREFGAKPAVEHTMLHRDERAR